MRSFSKDEAEEICDDFEDLIGTKFSDESYRVLRIKNVIPGPVPEAALADFMEEIRQKRTDEFSADHYHGEEYDVYVLAHDVNDDAFCYVSIRDFASSRGINYKFP